jgi:hypothetical protein
MNDEAGVFPTILIKKCEVGSCSKCDTLGTRPTRYEISGFHKSSNLRNRDVQSVEWLTVVTVERNTL